MKTSESIKELAQALAKAQGKIESADKSGKNPFFNNAKYSTISDVIETSKAALMENGLAIVQSPGLEGDRWILTTRLMHLSGEWIESQCPIISSKNDAQGFGSGLTYARRYALSSILNIGSEDDDGNAAAKPSQTRPQAPQQAIVQKTGQTSAQPQKPATAPPPPKRMTTDEMVKIYNGPVNNAAPPSKEDQQAAIRSMGRFDTK